MPRISIVVPAFNAANFITLTVKYALLSTYKDFEIVVVDDGSTDDTAALVDEMSPRVRLIRQANAGMSAARNTGIAGSDSEFVALLDSDDIWHPEKLGAQVDVLERQPECGFCFGEFRTWDGMSPIAFPSKSVSRELAPELSGWVYHQFVLTNWALPSTWLFRRSILGESSAFVTRDQKTDDWEFTIRQSRATRFAKLRDVVALYRQSPGQLSRNLRLDNPGRHMRERAIADYGLLGPDGTRVALPELRTRRFATELSFGADHIERGSVRVGVSCLVRAIKIRPATLRPYKVVASGLLRRLGRAAVDRVAAR